MIIANMAGGLANQMTIYAATLALAKHSNFTLKLDVTDLQKDPLRQWQLYHLNISATLASPEEISKIKRCSKIKFIEKTKAVIRKIFGQKGSIYREPLCCHDKSFWELPDNMHIFGYFLSTKYFDNIKDLLLKEFTIKSALSDTTEKLCDSLKRCESVSIHVRRGDYVTNMHTNKFHGLMDVEYYSRAMQIIESRVQNPSYFLFSDDMPWARENINTERPITFIEHAGQNNAYEDMHLMKHCKHNIIANSGFSFWSAWLNENNEQIVVAPIRWFANDEINSFFDPPSNWFRV